MTHPLTSLGLRLLAACSLAFGCIAAASAQTAATAGGGAAATTGGTAVLDASKVVELILALGLVIGCVVGMAWLARRLQRHRGNTGSLRLEAALAVGPKERVVIVNVDSQRVLLGVGAGQVSHLMVLPSSQQSGVDDAGTGAAPGRATGLTGAPGVGSFGQLLQSLGQRSSQ